jgi:hypothetical protein
VGAVRVGRLGAADGAAGAELGRIGGLGGEIGERDGAVGAGDPDGPLGELEICDVGFELVRGERLELLGELLAGLCPGRMSARLGLEPIALPWHQKLVRPVPTAHCPMQVR